MDILPEAFAAETGFDRMVAGKPMLTQSFSREDVSQFQWSEEELEIRRQLENLGQFVPHLSTAEISVMLKRDRRRGNSDFVF